jgi:hypothetical protein
MRAGTVEELEVSSPGELETLKLTSPRLTLETNAKISTLIGFATGGVNHR